MVCLFQGFFSRGVPVAWPTCWYLWSSPNGPGTPQLICLRGHTLGYGTFNPVHITLNWNRIVLLLLTLLQAIWIGKETTVMIKQHFFWQSENITRQFPSFWGTKALCQHYYTLLLLKKVQSFYKISTASLRFGFAAAFPYNLQPHCCWV